MKNVKKGNHNFLTHNSDIFSHNCEFISRYSEQATVWMYGQIQVRFVKSDFSDQFWEKKKSSELDFENWIPQNWI